MVRPISLIPTAAPFCSSFPRDRWLEFKKRAGGFYFYFDIRVSDRGFGSCESHSHTDPSFLLWLPRLQAMMESYLFPAAMAECEELPCRSGSLPVSRASPPHLYSFILSAHTVRLLSLSTSCPSSPGLSLPKWFSLFPPFLSHRTL